MNPSFANRTPIGVMTYPKAGGDRWHLAVQFGRLSHLDAAVELPLEATENEVREMVSSFLTDRWPDLDQSGGKWSPSIDGRGYYLKL